MLNNKSDINLVKNYQVSYLKILMFKMTHTSEHH
jgi:hypothetical protein